MSSPRFKTLYPLLLNSKDELADAPSYEIDEDGVISVEYKDLIKLPTISEEFPTASGFKSCLGALVGRFNTHLQLDDTVLIINESFFTLPASFDKAVRGSKPSSPRPKADVAVPAPAIPAPATDRIELLLTQLVKDMTLIKDKLYVLENKQNDLDNDLDTLLATERIKLPIIPAEPEERLPINMDM